MSHGPKRIHTCDSILVVETCASLWFKDKEPCEQCDDYLLDAWERMTTGGIRVQPCDIVPFNNYVNVGGVQMSYVAR